MSGGTGGQDLGIPGIADAVLVGRPILWGLALDGAAGVETVLTHLQTELGRAMSLCGAARLADITSDLVAGA